MSLWKQIAIVFVLGAVGSAAWLAVAPGTFPASFAALEQGGTGGDDAAQRRGRRGGGAGREMRVIAAKVSQVASGARVQAIGTAEAAQSVTLYPETTGIVAEVSFRAGDKVEAGQPLVRLDDAEQRILVEQARVELQTAEDALARPVKAMTHDERLEHVWSATHDEYRGYAGDRFLAQHRGKRTILVYGLRRTELKLLDDLTEEEIAAKLPVHLRHLPIRVAA